jgi:hypothetical protein
MATGIHTANLAHPWLNVLGAPGPAAGTTFTGITSMFVKLHISAGDPGPAGTANASANTTRVVVNWAAAATGSKAIQATFPVWAAWASGTEIIGFISLWDNITAGNFLFSVALTANKTVSNGDTLTLSSLSLALSPLAA